MERGVGEGLNLYRRFVEGVVKVEKGWPDGGSNLVPRCIRWWIWELRWLLHGLRAAPRQRLPSPVRFRRVTDAFERRITAFFTGTFDPVEGSRTGHH